MTTNKITDIVGKIVDLLAPLSSDDRRRVVSASLTLLGDEAVAAGKNRGEDAELNDDGLGVSPRARKWMGQNDISMDALHQVFQIGADGVEVIASEIPGKGKKLKTYNAYVLAAIARFLATGDLAIDDKSARALCVSSGCYDSANHAAYMRDKGNEFAGSKDKGWTLTTPGLKRGAELVKELSK